MNRRSFFSTLGLLPLTPPVELHDGSQLGRLKATVKAEFNRGRRSQPNQKTTVFIRKNIIYNYLGNKEDSVEECVKEKFDGLVKNILSQLDWFCEQEHEYDGCVTLDEYFPEVSISNGKFLQGWARMKIQM